MLNLHVRAHRFINNNIKRFQRIAIFGLVLSIIGAGVVSCDNSIGSKQNAKDISADWSSETQTLSVSGASAKSKQYVEIHDAADNRFLGAAIVTDDGTWAASATISACSVHVQLPNGTATVDVRNAPADCTAKKNLVGSRAVTANDLPINVKIVSNPLPNDTIPNAVILEPAQDLSINIGTSVNFKGLALGAGAKAPFGYYWNLGGAAPNSSIQNPGAVQFNTPGTYVVQLFVTDNLGIPDRTPAMRTITVLSPNSVLATPPVPQILAPTVNNGSVSINVGDSLFFSGMATNDIGAINFFYEWNFSGVIPNQFGPTPGAVVFSQAGVFLVSLFATDEQGVRSPTPAFITVSVSANGINQSPTGAIIVPPTDVVVQVGETIEFIAMGTDPDMLVPLSYSWDFQGAAPNISMSPLQTSGPVTFNTPGIFNVTMTVANAAGVVDTNPAVRVVTVEGVPLPPPANGAMVSQIISPPDRVKILPGQSVFFSGAVIGDAASQATQFYWNFDGGAVDSTLQTPGDITFAMPGKFNVTFYAMDEAGNILGEPASVFVRVSDPSSIEAEIETPSRRTPISAGMPVLLTGEIEHLLGATILSYEWRIFAIDSATGALNEIFNSPLEAPGTFVFNSAGQYQLSFKIAGIDILGAPFERMDDVTVTVTDALPGAASPITDPPDQTNPVPGTPVSVINGPAIDSPAADMMINLGDSVTFEANTINAVNVTYSWDFSGISPPSNLQNTGPVLFNMTGEFVVTLRISGIDMTGMPVDIFDQRLITVLAPTGAPADPIPPLGVRGISIPTTDLVITAGQSVEFRGSIIPAVSGVYTWDFAGNAPASNEISPAPVIFNTPGSYLVTLKIDGIHATKVRISVFDQRTITVLPAAGVGGGTGGAAGNTPVQPPTTASSTPEGYIVQPAQSFITVPVGQAVTFAGAGFDPLGNGPLSFIWNFGGVLTSVETQSPGNISFNQPGTHVVTLLVRNALGQYDPTPATVVITVTP